MKKIVSILLVIGGIILFTYGSYLSNQAEFNEGRVSQAEMGGQERRPTLGPIRRAARNEAAENKQEMLGQERQKIAVAEINASWLQAAGGVLFLVGGGIFIFFFNRKK